jgi:hypothetical protein
MFENLYINGYCHIQDLDITKNLIPMLNSFRWTKQGKMFHYAEHDQKHKTMLDSVNLLEERYVKFILPSYRLVDFCLWNGVDSGTQIWHEDLKEGYQISFLCYMSDTTRKTGGAIYFRDKNQQKKYVKIYPKIGDIIIMNHSSPFQHKVETLKILTNRFTFHAGFSLN